jgi:hypothetical protein
VVFTVSGRLDAENRAELEMLFNSEASSRRITLDLKELTLDTPSVPRAEEIATGIEVRVRVDVSERDLASDP